MPNQFTYIEWLPGLLLEEILASLRGGVNMALSKFFGAFMLSITLILSTNVLTAKQNIYSKNSIQISTWLWNTQDIVSNSDSIINFLSNHNVRNLYLQVNYDLRIDIYKTFIKKATLKKISVYALNGSPEWVGPDGSNKQKQFLDWLVQYQNTSLENERFKGVHLDVEPYLNNIYESNPNQVIESYQECLISIINKSNTLELPVSVDIPFWFDEVKYNTKYGSGILADWIISNTKDVVIMAYRDNALGENGIIKLTDNEMMLGKQYNAKITIAVETQELSEENNLTFFEEGEMYMNKQLTIVYNNYKKNSAFNGFAIHSVTSWMSLSK